MTEKLPEMRLLCESCESSTLCEIYEVVEEDADIIKTVQIQCSNCASIRAILKVRMDVGIFMK